MKVALVYDRVNKWGGAERVLLALHELFPDAPLYTSVYNKENAPWADVFTVIPSFLQRFPGAKTSHELYALLMPLAFEGFAFDEYDLVISLTSEAGKGILTKPQTKHLCFCLTPTRYLWSGYEDYFKNDFFRSITMPLVQYLRIWDLQASKHPDAYIAISSEVQKRIKKYYDQDSAVVYPPINIASSKSVSNGQLTNKKLNANLLDARRSSYFLVVSRLVPYKRIDLAIAACNKLQVPLKIIGSGSEQYRLQSLAGPTVEFLGNLTDDELVEYYRGCKALLFPGNEDFGLTIVEAQSFGKPVIAYKKGGAIETIVEGKTGLFFMQQNVRSLIEAIKLFDETNFSAQACRDQANKFSLGVFKKELTRVIDTLI